MRDDQRDFRAQANMLLTVGIARKKGLGVERKIMNTQEHSSLPCYEGLFRKLQMTKLVSSSTGPSGHIALRAGRAGLMEQ